MSTIKTRTAIAREKIGLARSARPGKVPFYVILRFACQSRYSRPAAGIIAAVVFLLDALTSLDIAIAVLYVLVVLLSLNFATQTGLVVIGSGCIGLTVLGLLISHGDGLPALEDSLGRCFVSVAAIGITTLLAVRVKAAIAVLAESEQRYRTIFLTTGVGILQLDFTQLKAAVDKLKTAGVRDIDHARSMDLESPIGEPNTIRLINANDTALKMFNAADIIALETMLPKLINADVDNAWKFLAAVWSGKSSYEAETIIDDAQGRQMAVLYNVAFPANRPALDMVLLSIMDVTGRREAENQLHAARAELAHVARVATLGELTVSIAHELNQPLAAVVANGGAGLRWLQRDVPDLEKIQLSMEGMIADAHRASEIIKNLRALSAKSPPKSTHVNLNEILDETVALVRREIDIHQVSLQFHLATDLPGVNGDRVQLQQVILNLVLNAIQAMTHAAGNTRKLLIETFAEERAALVKIHDNGPGLTPETRTKLFSPFYTTKPDGMGMGLSICRSIVNAHGGSISASSKPGAGTIFEFTIPLVQGTG
ncbi:sensor histidine kinase [Phyllobacterium endophyticum]|uniref:sensor histidine kinase n=1 Tax=Phyllobacterium endophyticum TaxID=1149773 RepID=UPI0011C98377|nr:ATP-binding protein [Phyllobacterium endophyticum]TXR48418.1 serine/threonine protein kinase [Phyllobacterium endophyticum]